MSPIVLWMLGISASTALLIATVALELKLVQFSLCFVVVGFIALAGVRDQRMLQEIGAFPSHVSATMIRHMGIMYGWSAAMLALLYTLLLDWSHWFGAFFVMCAGATLCLFLANIIMRDLNEATTDRRMSALVKTIAKFQFAATCLCVGGLAVVGASAPTDAGSSAWAGVNIMLATAFGLAALSAYVVFFPNGFDFIDDQPEADGARKKMSGTEPVLAGENHDRRQGDRRKNDRGQGDRRQGDRRQTKSFGRARPA